MNKITFPLKLQIKGPKVGDLHAGLQSLGYVIADAEKSISRFGASTRQALLDFQSKHGLAASGEVDEMTAASLNQALASPSALDGPTNWLVHGRITYKDGQPAAHVIVRVFDRDVAHEARLGETATNAEGCYSLSYAESAFRRTPAERGGPELLLRVFGQDLMFLGQSKILRNAPADATLHLQVSTGMFRVFGRVAKQDGIAVSGLKVVVVDRDLRKEEALGTAVTDAQGRYEILYSREQFARAEKDRADLVVKALVADGSVLVASPILFNAAPVTEINLAVPSEIQRPLSLFEKIGRELPPLLDGVRVEDLEEDKEHQDLSFLAGETGFEKRDLARFALAHRLARQGIQPEFWFALLDGSFYQFTENRCLKEQLSAILDSLSSLDAAAVGKALTRSFSQNEIPEAFREQVAGWVEAFLIFAASRSVSAAAGSTFVKSALEHANIKSAKKQRTFARLFNEHKALTPELLAALENDPSFREKDIADLHASFRLAELTRGDFSVVKMLKEEFGVRQPEQIRTLAKKSEVEWVNLVKAKHAAGAIKLPIEVGEITGQIKFPAAEIYGKTLERQFREAFPTTAFAGGLARALQNGGAHGLRRAQEMGRFLESHETFELLNTPVDDFLKNNTRPDFRTLAEEDDFRLELKAVQRVFKLVPTFEATNAMLADGVHSAQMAYRMGESEFVRRYAERPGFTAESAQLAWSRAADTHAAVLTLVADLKALEGRGQFFALKNNSDALANFPNWNNLFQGGDLCECEHCRSVLGPAAYFADMLMFLKDRTSKKPKPDSQDHYFVKDLLFNRRPDLGFLELNCDNALTQLPYIDVVCEVLENAVDATRENDLELVIPAVPAGDLYTILKKAFTDALADPINDGKEKIELGGNLSYSVLDPADPDQGGVLHSDDVTYLIKKKDASTFFAEILRNTKAGAAELRAYPQYVNSMAYEKLRQAKYPLGLPFDLFSEEVRAAFQKTNLQRWDLMRTLRGTAAPNNPTAGEIAAEYFGISADASAAFDEKRLILVADPTDAGQQAVWGETGNADWLTPAAAGEAVKNSLCNVKYFLQKTGLEYNQLLALLDLEFINPASDITVHHLDPSCDTEKKVILALNAKKMDRIHRFLRLWRKLKGWKMWELDLVICQPGVGDPSRIIGKRFESWLLSEKFLINLFYFSQLRDRLGRNTSIEQVCALFGNLNTKNKFIKLHEKREEALYQNLFLNRRLINPLDPAFQLDPATDDLPHGEINAHHPVILAALGIREAELILFKELTKVSGPRYITGDLTLGNLSFLWRHAWLSNVLKFKAEEWKTMLKVLQQDLLHFATPEAAWKFVEQIDHLKDAGFTPDELNWLVAADRTAKAAPKEADDARFLAALRKELQSIQAEYDPKSPQYALLSPPGDVDALTTLLNSHLQKLNRDEAATRFFIATLRDEVAQAAVVAGLPAGFDFPEAIQPQIRIRYDEPTTTLSFIGLMTATERKTLVDDASLAAVYGNASYQEAIEGLFTRPRLALKFFEPVFTAPLANLPATVDFKSLPSAALALKISYDAEQHLLRFAGILARDEKSALDALSADVDYRKAVTLLFTQPDAVLAPEKTWLLDADLKFPLHSVDGPDKDNLAENLAKAATKALAYLFTAQSENATVRQCSAQLGLTEALTRRLLTHYALLPDTLLTHLSGVFAATTGVVDHTTLPTAFDGWFWANRVAALLKKWKITLEDLNRLVPLADRAQLLDFRTLPLNVTGSMASLERLLRTARLLRIRDSLPEGKITVLEILEKLNNEVQTPGTYVANDFATDVQLLNEEWRASDVMKLTASLDLAYPAVYLLAESWERLRRVFYFLDNLNAGADTVTAFAAAAMTAAHAKTLKELLRSKFGAETWLTLSADIQDTLRERKRDALAAYLLTQPPVDAPTGKWENTHDLYAYYLLDVEMSSCQLTSRLVQASGSVQLFVQRCFMGLEPEVVVQADGPTGDSAWRWWKWMRKYQVWVANRKVFLWPENWIEPELKKDRSPFFKDMENELLQNEMNQYTAETAFSNYLEKLHGVAQLEIAGFYQEDDGDDTIVHVFGRTAGVEPHLYYYRRYDYRQWSPWEKVELDIQGDYLIPAVVNKRLFLFWPIFTEVPDEAGNSRVTLPRTGDTGFTPEKTKKRLRLQMAVSNYRQGQWTPKKVSTDFHESEKYSVEIERKHYRFFAVDRTDVGGSFRIGYAGFSVGSAAAAEKTKADLEATADRTWEASTKEKTTKDNYETAFGEEKVATVVLQKARAAVTSVKFVVNLAKDLPFYADRIVGFFESSFKDATNFCTGITYVINLVGPAKTAANTAKTAVATATDDSSDATQNVQMLIAALNDLLGKYNEILTNIYGADTYKKSEAFVIPLVKSARNFANSAKEAGDEALRTIMAFKDDAARTAASAAKELVKAKRLAQEAKEANDAFSPDVSEHASMYGAFEISGGKGVPELTSTFTEKPRHILRPESDSVGDNTVFLKWVELGKANDPKGVSINQDNDFALQGFGPVLQRTTVIPVLQQTPGIFKMSPPWHLSYFDKFLLRVVSRSPTSDTSAEVEIGTGLPFFYNDKKRTFFVLPSVCRGARDYYPEIKKGAQKGLDGYEQQQLLQTYLNSFDVNALSDSEREQWERLITQVFGDEVPTEEQLKNLVKWKITQVLFYNLYDKQWGQNFMAQQFHFKTFYHPFVCDFAKLVYNPLKGIPALMSRETQLKNTGFSFERSYFPTDKVVKLPPQYPLLKDCYPNEVVDFTPDGAYSPYNWELFFHAPLLIANALSKNQRFEEAQEWYHFIFNPIGVESSVPGGLPMSKYWITKPFFETTEPQYVQQRIDNIMRMLAGDTNLPGFSAQARKDLEDQVSDWRTNPFEPHRIANYRTVAYQKTVVMKYLDNLVAWGDNLFRQDSMECINTATQLYILAAELLGPRPNRIPPKRIPPAESFNELETEFDKFSNALVRVENLVPVLSDPLFETRDRPQLPMLYFCIPQNDKMLGYWDTVADRLYKIRHCMNIEGVVRQLALFEPPIDPAALVKAVAGGVDISSALADLNAPLPLYRFNILLQKANEVCNDVKALGSALLSALEKKDAEAMGLLRQSHEIRVLEAVKAIREKQIEEAKENLEGVKKSKELITIRRDYYQNIEKINASEQLYQDKLEQALIAQQISQLINSAASIAHLIPDLKLGVSGFGGTPEAGFAFGGSQLGSSLQAVAGGFSVWANVENFNANKASINASHERRWEDWKLQESLANKELEQIDKQIASAELRIAIAEKELNNHVLQIENAKATDEFMRSKYTSQELYQWQVGQISGVYFQSYKLAYDLAKRAERCFRFELGMQDSSYINFGYWDSLKKGLLSGEKLQYDLRRLEAAYLERNRREFELSKHISLTLLDPLALVKFRETGRCFFRLPEEIFDLDYPGHYFRRIKSVSLTLPCVVGPYTTISCTLRLLKNSIRINTTKGDNDYPRNTDEGLPADDSRFIENNIPVKAIAASSGQNDSGVFELSFRDERYLPFEGAGAISEWSLELFNDLPSNNPDSGKPDFGKPLRQFDYGTISDAILHVKYTAREDAGPFKNGAINHLREYFRQDDAPTLRLFNLRQEFPSQWHRFLNPTNPANGNVVELEMSPSLFPFLDGGKTLIVNKIWLLARCTNAESYEVVITPPLPAPPAPSTADPNKMTLARVNLNLYGGMHFCQKVVDPPVAIAPTDTPIIWQLKVTPPDVGANLAVAEVENLFLVVGYKWE
jgi:peptidoglycan hydrolase-like protein with peptidoglycan-binding domain